MPIARISSHEAKVNEIRKRYAQRASTDFEAMDQRNKFRPGVPMQLRNNQYVPAVLYETG